MRLEEVIKLASKEERKAEIRALSQTKFDDWQIELMCKLIDRCVSEREIEDLYNLLIQRVKFGLTFDWSPEPNQNLKQIPIFIKDQELSFKTSRERERERAYQYFNSWQ